MPKLPVKSLPSSDAGRLLVRLNYKHRNRISRYGTAKIINVENQRWTLAIMLGHEDEEAIYMPFDIRASLEIAKGDKLEFQIESVGLIGKLFWYVTSPDPAVHLPAWLASASLVLATIGVILAIFV